MAGCEEEGILKLSLDDRMAPSQPPRPRLSLDQVWHDLHLHSSFLAAASPKSLADPVNLGCPRPSSLSGPAPFPLQSMMPFLEKRKQPLLRSDQHISPQQLVKALEFLVEQMPSSSSERQHCQEALEMQRKRKLRAESQHAAAVRRRKCRCKDAAAAAAGGRGDKV